MINTLTLQGYLLKAEEYLLSEEKRASYLFLPGLKEAYLTAVKEELLYRPAPQLINDTYTGCASMLENQKHEGLALMHKLLGSIEELEAIIITKLGEYIRERVTKMDTKDPIQYLGSILTLTEEIKITVERSFSNNASFQDAA